MYVQLNLSLHCIAVYIKYGPQIISHLQLAPQEMPCTLELLVSLGRVTQILLRRSKRTAVKKVSLHSFV
jgi:hypothetical protein